MIEKIYKFTITDAKTIERIVDDEHSAINHMILNRGEALPIHDSNSHVYLIIVRGKMSIALAEQDTHMYETGDIVNVPFGVRMHIRNEQEPVLEFFVLKAPNPREFLGK